MPVYEKQSIVSRMLKTIAREFNIAVCALCQVSRGAEGQNKPPLLSDLRGSGSIEQDADLVMFIHGERIIPKSDESADRDLIIAKNRNGECTGGKIRFIKATAKYTNKQKEDFPQ
jgi:replicative DNA helicase